MSESESTIGELEPKQGQVRFKGSKEELQRALKDLTSAGYKCGEMSEGPDGTFWMICEKDPE